MACGKLDSKVGMAAAKEEAAAGSLGAFRDHLQLDCSLSPGHMPGVCEGQDQSPLGIRLCDLGLVT